MAPSSAPCWLASGQQPGMAASTAQGPWWPSFGASASPIPTTKNSEEHDLQAWGSDSHPPGGFVNLLKQNAPSRAQIMSNWSSSRPINVDDTNNDDCIRTEKRLLWTKEEDLKLVSAWLNNSNDPIQANYKKNDQYWKGVAAVLFPLLSSSCSAYRPCLLPQMSPMNLFNACLCSFPISIKQQHDILYVFYFRTLL